MDKYLKQWRTSSITKNSNKIPTEQSTDSRLELDKEVDTSSASWDPISENSSSNEIPSVVGADLTTANQTAATSSKRKFLPKWSATFTWLIYNESSLKAFCSVCTEAYIVLKVKLPNDGANDQRSYLCFVKDGYSNWKHALDTFKSHERSNVHRKAVTSIISHRGNANVAKLISEKHLQERKDARLCLIKICESIRFLAVQGLPLRGHTEDNSNFIQLLHLRASDNPILKLWMERSKYKWISHDVMNEILTLMSLKVQKSLLLKVSKAPFFAIMGDETIDISRKEQMSFNFRVVDDDLTINEYFMGLYNVPATDSETLFEVVNDVLLRYQLKLGSCRGQCYDGANNVSGSITGLQTRVRNVEPRALYTHCAGHNTNLVAQDSMSKIPEIADLLSNIRELVTFIRASPKRINIFNNIKSQLDDDGQKVDRGGSLTPLCPTRWCVRVKSTKSVRDNYKEIIEFCDVVGQDMDEAGVKARGFLKYLNKFETFLLLQTAIVTLEQVEALNETLQAKTINFKSVIKRVEHLKSSLNSIRTDQKFNTIWESTFTAARDCNLDNKEPKPLRKTKLPKRFDTNDTAYFPTTAKEQYRRIYLQVIDQIVMSINTRFDSETYTILSKMDDFAMNKCGFDDIKEHLLKDGQCDFDAERLILHRNLPSEFS